MSHNHNHSGGHHHHHHAVKNIKIAFFLNFTFTIIEFIGGYLTNSVAIMSDALHDLGDSFALGLAWFLEKVSSKKRTQLFSYGYKRFSLLGAFINAIILLGGSIFILIKAVPRIITPEMTNVRGMILLSLFGIVVNGLAVYKTSSGKTMNEKVISLHLLEDVLGWVAVLAVSIVMLFTNLPILDPILSVLITLYILWGVLKNLKATALLFLQAVPQNLSADIIDKHIKKDVQVVDVHDIHVWSLDGEKHILTAHVVINNNCLKEEIKNIKYKVKDELKKIGIEHSTLEIEFEDENCVDYC